MVEGRTQQIDAVTEKQMEYLGWVATNLDLAGVQATARSAGLEGLDTVAERQMFSLFSNGMLREWENSYSQYERGLFTPEEFEPRMERWRLNIGSPGYHEVWLGTRMTFAPSFRAEIDRIVAEVGG